MKNRFFQRGGEMEQYTELVNQAKQGSVQAFSGLYESCYKDLYRFALYNLGHEEDAKDAVSDTVLAAFENIGKLREADAFRAWIFRILYNPFYSSIWCQAPWERQPDSCDI